MNLNVYADIGQLTKIGEIAILYDRIVSIDFKFPCPTKNKSTASKKKRPGSIYSYITYNQETAYPYTVKKLSKADLPFRNFKLTHQVTFNGLKEASQFNFYIRLTYIQCFLIKYYNKEFICQSTEFKKKIWYSVISYLVPVMLGIVVTLFFIGSSKNDKKEKGFKNEMIQKVEDSIKQKKT